MFKKEAFLPITILLLLSIFSSILLWSDPTITGFTTSGVSIRNTPPNFTKIIPDQNWTQPNSFINAFNLDDHFNDVNEDLSYTSTGNTSIIISINETTNNVSFFQPITFTGSENVVFYALDGTNNTPSNNVTLTVNATQDTSAPNWSNIKTNQTTTYETNNIKFTADWQDNIGLQSYLFSINQSGPFVNSSKTEFTGLTNISKKIEVITAIANTTVEWLFIAYDTSNNLNITPTQSFVVGDTIVKPSSDGSSKEADTIVDDTAGAIGTQNLAENLLKRFGKLFLDAYRFEKYFNFTVDPELLKVSIKQERTDTKILTVKNTASNDLNIQLSTQDPNNFFRLSKRNISLTQEQSTPVTLDISTTFNHDPDIYFGKIRFSHPNVTRNIPVVVEVNELELDYDLTVTISKENKIAYTDTSITADINIRSLKETQPIDANLYYAILTLDGVTVDSKQETRLMSNNQLFNTSLYIPPNQELGEHIFFTRLIIRDKVIISNDDFKVAGRYELPIRVAKINLIVGSVLVILFLVITIIIRYRRMREKNKLLNLYFLINQAKKYLAYNDIKNATASYVKIKLLYNESVPPEDLENEYLVKKRLNKLIKKLSKNHLNPDYHNLVKTHLTNESDVFKDNDGISSNPKKESRKSKIELKKETEKKNPKNRSISTKKVSKKN